MFGRRGGGGSLPTDSASSSRRAGTGGLGTSEEGAEEDHSEEGIAPDNSLPPREPLLREEVSFKNITEAEDRLQNGLMRRALSWLDMLAEGLEDEEGHPREYPLDQQLVVFKTISDWFTRSRRTKGERDGEGDLPGIEELKKIMSGEFLNLVDQHGVLAVPPKKVGARTRAEQARLDRLKGARDIVTGAVPRAKTPPDQADDGRLRMMLRRGQRAGLTDPPEEEED